MPSGAAGCPRSMRSVQRYISREGSPKTAFRLDIDGDSDMFMVFSIEQSKPIIMAQIAVERSARASVGHSASNIACSDTEANRR